MEKDLTKLPILSYSKVTTYKSCPKKYKFAYIDKLPRVDRPFTIFGNFCHEVLEKFHGYYLADETKDYTYVEAMQKAFSIARENWKDKILKEQVDEAYSIMMDYLILISSETDENKPTILAVERKIWTPIEDEIVLYGYIDRVQRDKDGLLHIVDYKTTKDPKYLKDRTQLLLYGYSLLTEDDTIDRIRTSYILLKHKMKYMTEEHSRQELVEAKIDLLNKWKEVVEDKLYRASPSKFVCTYCDYINNCDEGKGLIFGASKYFGKVSW